MKKENFVSLILGTIGGIIFALGMCMCMISEWNVFNYGIITGTIGLIILIIMIIVRRKMQGKSFIKINLKIIKILLLAIVGTLTLGLGMCMTMVLQGLMLQGIILGIAGIILLISLIPLYKGVK